MIAMILMLNLKSTGDQASLPVNNRICHLVRVSYWGTALCFQGKSKEEIHEHFGSTKYVQRKRTEAVPCQSTTRQISSLKRHKKAKHS